MCLEHNWCRKMVANDIILYQLGSFWLQVKKGTQTGLSQSDLFGVCHWKVYVYGWASGSYSQCCYSLHVCVSPHSYVEILAPSVMVLGNGAFWRWSGHGDRALINVISASWKISTPESSLAPATVWETARRQWLWPRKWALIRCWICQCLGLWLPRPQNCKK